MGQTVQIERMSYGAAAIGRLPDGKAVFVDGAAPGDVCEVHVVEEKRSFARAELTEVLEASAARVALDAKRCVGDSIPGAPWAHLAYSAQLEAKRQNLVEALVRVGKMERAIVIPHLGASTAEAEDNCAKMSVEEVMAYLERGEKIHCVNM